ncbi:imidazole glycerol phosphate synthase subunit HisH [Aliidiomarina taiwanensis]|uniref:Imidazole glycerol phosphate synthase subunit HisH n=1 Tax=Aliidiomarina taiwanensis TaxID=946228 RepID=A0A432WTH9_9GAMM|nr:imidazole glycerol phosphate synthase subunit HisH [Aliidiomarina taiwanensis]RUO37048.1 imidazole glycerol phosphate synthase subunit HisH [Aliidiomarina taiwanensis]
MITIVDYGSGNIQAIKNIYKKLNIQCVVAKEPESILAAKKLILPGVGAFDETMAMLRNTGLQKALNTAVLEQDTPIIGICVGMQIMAKSSDEGVLPGLGWIDAEVKQIDTSLLISKPMLPHMGWNSIHCTQENPLFNNISIDKGFYFLHSYYFSCSASQDSIATVNYGKDFSCVVNHRNIYGVQFHPEKSHDNGVTLFKNFSEL